MSLLIASMGSSQTCRNLGTDSVRIRSVVMNEDRVVLVHVPSGYCQSAARYPVLYMIDADQYLGALAGTVDFLSANDRIPALIIVGLTHADRTHDLTPTASTALTADGKPSPLPTSGGGPAFRQMIASELIPLIDRQYRTTSFRVLFGHSFGGLFAVDVLLAQPDLFKAYIAASPSLWWDGERELKVAARAFDQGIVPRAFLYLSIANESDISRSAFAAFRDRVQAERGSGLSVVIRTFDDEEHVSSVAPAFYDGLRAVFAAWPIPRDANSRIPLGGVSGLESHYADRARLLGYPQPVPEAAYLALGGQALATGRTAQAVEALSRAAEQYPQSAVARDRLGSALLSTGNVEEARQAFQAAVALGESQHDPAISQYRAHLDTLNRDDPRR